MTDQTPQSGQEEQPVPRPDYRVAILSALGILGFILGCIILFYSDMVTPGTRDSVFHEIVYEPGHILETPLTNAIKDLNDSLRLHEQEKKAIGRLLKNTKAAPAASRKADSLNERDADLQRKIAQDNNNIHILRTYQVYAADAGLADSNSFKKLNQALHFTVTPDDIVAWDTAFTRHGDSLFPVYYALRDTALSYAIAGIDTLRLRKFPTDVRFISKYPGAGAWILSIFIFCSFALISIATCIHLNKKATSLLGQDTIKALSAGRYYWSIILILCVLTLLAIIWRNTFYDEEPIKNLFFLRTLRTSMLLITMLGYLCGAFCLAGFIHTSAMLGCIANDIKEKTRKIVEKKQAALSQAPSARTEQAGEDQETADLENKRALQKKTYDSLLKIFNTYFLFSAITLTLLVICSGGIFGLTNSIDFMRLLADDWSRSTARPDFVYLYGGIHTILLLVFYIPAKMRFSEANIAGEPGAQPSGNGKLQDFFKGPFSQVKELLVAVSPLLASLAQSLFDALFR